VAPAIAIVKNGLIGATVLGSAKGSPRPLDVSMYVGRVPGSPASLSISVLGVGADGASVAFDVVPSGDPTRQIDGISWQSYSGQVAVPTVGWLDVFIDDTSADQTWIMGPIAIEAPRERRIGATPRPRAPTAFESRMSRHNAEQQKKHLGGHRVERTAWPRP